MFDSNSLYQMGKQHQRDLIADAEARRLAKQLGRGHRANQRRLPGHIIRLATMLR